MKTLLFILILFIPVLSSAQKKIKSPVILSSGDTLQVDDIIIIKNGTFPDSSYRFVQTTSGFSAPKKCKGYEQTIYYFRYLDETYYAYTVGFKIDVEKALNSGEIIIRNLRKATTAKVPEALKVDTKKPKEIFQPESIYLSQIKNIKPLLQKKLLLQEQIAHLNFQLDSINKLIKNIEIKDLEIKGLKLKCVIAKNTYLSSTPNFSGKKIIDVFENDTVILIDITKGGYLYVSFQDETGFLLKSEIQNTS